jgi:hypothetical protein
MKKLISGLLSLSTLALVGAAPLVANALPGPGQPAPLLARYDRDYDDHRRDDYRRDDYRRHDWRRRSYDDSYVLFCRRRHHQRWRQFGQYDRRFSAMRAKYDYEWQGYNCYVNRYDY